MNTDYSHTASSGWIWLFFIAVPAVSLVISAWLRRRERIRQEKIRLARELRIERIRARLANPGGGPRDDRRSA